MCPFRVLCCFPLWILYTLADSDFKPRMPGYLCHLGPQSLRIFLNDHQSPFSSWNYIFLIANIYMASFKSSVAIIKVPVELLCTYLCRNRNISGLPYHEFPKRLITKPVFAPLLRNYVVKELRSRRLQSAVDGNSQVRLYVFARARLVESSSYLRSTVHLLINICT